MNSHNQWTKEGRDNEQYQVSRYNDRSISGSFDILTLGFHTWVPRTQRRGLSCSSSIDVSVYNGALNISDYVCIKV